MDRYRDIYTGGERIGDAADEVERKIAEELVPRIAAEHGLDDTSRMITSGKDAAACLVRR